MAGFGSMILEMLGQQDPRRQLVAAALQPGSGTSTPGSTAVPPATPVAGGTPQPTAYTSPPQLLELYDSLINRSSRERRIDQGIGLIASSFARPENKGAILSATQGNYESPSDIFGLITGLQAMQQEQADKEKAAALRASQLADLPQIAEKYGLDSATARMLFDSEQLDDYVMQSAKFREEAAKPNNEVVKLQDGTQVVANKNTGEIVAQLGEAGKGGTDLLQNYNSYVEQERAAGNVPMSQLDYELARQKAGATTINLGNKTAVNAAGDKLGGTAVDRYYQGNEIVKSLSNIDAALEQFNRGLINGSPASDLELQFRKGVQQLFGGTDEEIANTETFQSYMKNQVLPLVKQLGTGNSISNADREFIEKAIAGDIKLDNETQRRVLLAMRRLQIDELGKINTESSKFAEASDDNMIKKMMLPYAIPAPSKAYVNAMIGGVPSAAIEELMSAPDDQQNLQEFADAFNMSLGDAAAIVAMIRSQK